jgi:hypothetical protein
MINLIVCIIFLILSIYFTKLSIRWSMSVHSIYVMIGLEIIKISSFFFVGFFGSETLKYFIGLPTIIF